MEVKQILKKGGKLYICQTPCEYFNTVDSA